MQEKYNYFWQIPYLYVVNLSQIIIFLLQMTSLNVNCEKCLKMTDSRKKFKLTIPTHLVPRAKASLSPDPAPWIPFLNQTVLSLDIAQTTWLPTATVLKGEFGPGGSNTDHELPVGSSLVIPSLTNARPCHVTAHTRPVGPMLIWLTSHLS